ncbi:tRNA 2-selenouridine(34) synthase MnmH [Candidatus Cyanaurora vandensis]|uniref:tRNA 2-selenouridine(34) synthase MnmH n=1 Tax=Candidatus Cyanaurora vandensis TaxID=2714958 RepID=UPI00257B80C6|nr:tRNA 2-selenouridine(34) synthase MnmH [Candidatus Cyanaurora vandensis]
MTPPIRLASSPWPLDYSEIVDVRSPGEYAEDHIPGAVNLPILDDQERAEVGTLYAQDSFAARKLGAALVSQNIAHHLLNHFERCARDYRPLVYCWRGGQRSGSLATVLTEIGWQVTVLTGGYKTYRREVQAQLAQLPTQFKYHVLCGPTGSGKTLLLGELSRQGAQVLDLEHLAQHRGSLLGQTSVPQPTQKYFDSLLLAQLQQFDPNRVVWVESESAKVGQIHLSKPLLTTIAQGMSVEIQAPLAVRTQWIIHEYPHFIAHPNHLKQQLQALIPVRGHATVQAWFDLIDRGQWTDFVTRLLQDHYDPTYTHSLTRRYAQMDRTITLADLAAPDLDQAVTELLHLGAKAGVPKF